MNTTVNSPEELHARLTVLYLGKVNPEGFQEEIMEAWNRFIPFLGSPESEGWQKAYAELNNLIERGPTESQKRKAIRKTETDLLAARSRVKR